MTREQLWSEIYDILIEEAGASPDDKSCFVHAFVEQDCTEWRFCGTLGFGGKCCDYRDDRGIRVTCYAEDRTPERDEIIKRTNARIAAFMAAD